MRDNKFVLVLNKQLPPGVALNAAAHLAVGLASSSTNEQIKEMNFIDYVDKDSNIYPNISALSLIVLRGKSNEIKKIRNKCIENNIQFCSFLETMTGETYVEQLEKTRQKTYDEINFYGVMLFGKKEIIDPLTRKLSLWK